MACQHSSIFNVLKKPENLSVNSVNTPNLSVELTTFLRFSAMAPFSSLDQRTIRLCAGQFTRRDSIFTLLFGQVPHALPRTCSGQFFTIKFRSFLTSLIFIQLSFPLRVWLSMSVLSQVLFQLPWFYGTKRREVSPSEGRRQKSGECCKV